MILNIELINECCMANCATAYIKSRVTIKTKEKIFDLTRLFFKNKKIKETKEIAEIVILGRIRETFAKISLDKYINQDYMETISEHIKEDSRCDLELSNIEIVDFKIVTVNMVYN